MWIPSIVGLLTSVQWFPVPSRNIVLVNPFEWEQHGGSVNKAECGSLCVCLHVCLEMVDWGDQRKQDANEPSLINVCLISYSALSGHGKDKAEERAECWVEFMRKCRPSLWFTPSAEKIGSQEVLGECKCSFLQTWSGVVGVSESAELLLHSSENNLMIHSVKDDDTMICVRLSACMKNIIQFIHSRGNALTHKWIF